MPHIPTSYFLKLLCQLFYISIDSVTRGESKKGILLQAKTGETQFLSHLGQEL